MKSYRKQFSYHHLIKNKTTLLKKRGFWSDCDRDRIIDPEKLHVANKKPRTIVLVLYFIPKLQTTFGFSIK